MKQALTFGLIALGAYVLYEHFSAQSLASSGAAPSAPLADPTLGLSVQPTQQAMNAIAPAPSTAGNISATTATPPAAPAVDAPASTSVPVNPLLVTWAPDSPSIMWGCWTLQNGQRACA